MVSCIGENLVMKVDGIPVHVDYFGSKDWNIHFLCRFMSFCTVFCFLDLHRFLFFRLLLLYVLVGFTIPIASVVEKLNRALGPKNIWCKLRTYVFWPHLFKDTRDRINSCWVCQLYSISPILTKEILIHIYANTYLYPNIVQATFAAFLSKKSSHTVPHCPL